MIRRLTFLLVVLLVLVLLAMSPYIGWRLSPTKDLRIVVVDKTVPFENYNEHASLFWVLNHARYPAPDDHDQWYLATDYVGYYPSLRGMLAFVNGEEESEAGQKKWRHTWRDLTDADVAGKDAIYLADTYGVYSLDLEHIDDEEAHLLRNPLVYGAFKPEEIGVLERFAEKGGTVIAEFNTFALPTGVDVRQRFEALLHVEWTDWVGRYVDDLANEEDIPWWVYELWRRQARETEWHFSGPGFIFVDTHERLVVLQAGEDVGGDLIRIHNLRDSDPLLEGTTDQVPYYYWFDVVRPGKGTTVHSEMVIDATPEGEKKLAEFGIPTSFPAVISYDGPYKAFYFAGDFADNKLEDAPYQVAWYPSYRRWFARYRSDPTNEWFFWEYYLPLVQNVLGGLEAGR